MSLREQGIQSRVHDMSIIIINYSDLAWQKISTRQFVTTQKVSTDYVGLYLIYRILR